jgi:hypothetical protein
MSSVPLAALSLHPQVAPPDPLEQYGRLMQLKQQQQMAPLQLQAAQNQAQSSGLQVQQQQQALTDQKAMTTAMQGWDKKDYNDLIPLLIKNGGSAQAVMGLKSKILEQQQVVSTAFKNNAEGAQAQMSAAKTKGDLLDGALSPLVDSKQVPDAQLPQAITQAAQDLMQKGVLDPQHGQAAQQIAQTAAQNPEQARQQLDLMRKSSLAQSQILEDAAKQATTAESTATAAKTGAEVKYYQQNGGAPGVPAETQELNSFLKNNPGKTAADFGAFRAASDARARQPYEVSLDRARQAIQDGDPKSAAQLLINGDVAPSQLISSRKPEFAQKAFQAAHDMSNGQWNAQAAEGNYKVASSPANVGFFGSAKSLTDKGGTLDQLQEAAKDIPGGQIPIFNSVADAVKAATGSGPVAKYAALALGVSDDYSKVMGGGQGSDSSRQQALQLISAKASPEQRQASIDGIRGAVDSQASSRIGNNPVLSRMYGTPKSASSPSAAPAPSPAASALSVKAPNGKTYTFKDQASADAFKQTAGIQ